MKSLSLLGLALLYSFLIMTFCLPQHCVLQSSRELEKKNVFWVEKVTVNWARNSKWFT